ncbi:hypothetical protein Pelo_2319 [Pelomyxa schiedti]|nr:hypothetical protein Pelo_2319 [Pelomyxa schiedti]
MLSECGGQVWIVVPLSFITGLGAASLGASAWMMIVPVLLLFECWNLYDVLLIACCMDIASSAAITAVYSEQKYIWKAPGWIALGMAMAVVEITVIIGLLHELVMRSQSFFETGSAIIAFLLGAGMLGVGLYDIIMKYKSWKRAQTKSEANKLQSRLTEPDSPSDSLSGTESEVSIITIDIPNEGTQMLLPKTGNPAGDPEVEQDERKVPIQWVFLRRFHVHKAIIIGFFILFNFGCYATVGFFGWGSGAFNVVVLVTHTDVALHTATGTASLLTLVSSAAFAVNVMSWKFTVVSDYWQLLLALVAGQLVGTVCGTIMVLKVPKHLIKATIGAVLLGVGISSLVTWSVLQTE